MALADRTRPARPPKQCAVLTRVAAEDREALLRMLDLDSGWTNGEIADALAEENVEISESAVSKHRRRRCPCY